MLLLLLLLLLCEEKKEKKYSYQKGENESNVTARKYYLRNENNTTKQ